MGGQGAGRAGLGWEGGRVGLGGGTCVFIHKNVFGNRVECCFGAVRLGKKKVFFTRFFQGGTRLFLQIQDFSRGRKLQESIENRINHERG